MPPSVTPKPDPNQISTQPQPTQTIPSVQPAVFSNNQPSSGTHPRKNLLLIAGAASAVIIAGIIFLALQLAKSPTVSPSKSTPSSPATQKTTPAATKTTPATANTTTLVPTNYDDGQGQPFKVLFYEGAVQKKATELPSDSTMSFIAGNGDVLEQSDANTSSPLILYMTTGGNPDGSCTEVFSVTVASAGDVKVCGSDNTLYTMQFTVGKEDYFASVATLSDSDLTPYNSDLKQIFASVVPLPRSQ